MASPDADLENALQCAAAVLHQADALLICTGAGMGADSGLRTFRGRNVGGPGLLLGCMLAVLGRSWGSVGGPGPLLEPMLAVLGRS